MLTAKLTVKVMRKSKSSSVLKHNPPACKYIKHVDILFFYIKSKMLQFVNFLFKCRFYNLQSYPLGLIGEGGSQTSRAKNL